MADLGADADDARLVEIAQGVLADVGDVAGDLLRPELGVAGFDLELLDVDGGVVVVLDQLFGDQDGVLEVVTAPGHEGDQDVAAQAELALLGAWAVGDDLALEHAVAVADDGLLVDAGVLVGALELGELIDVRADLARELRGVVLAFDAHDDALGVDRIDDAVALGQDDGAGVARGDALHAGADEGSFADQQRNRLALHVGAHQRAVGVVMLQERNQRRGNRDQLLGRDIDVVHVGLVDQHEVALAARIDHVLDDVQLLVQLDVGLRDGVAVLLPRGEIEAEGLELHGALLVLLAAASLSLRASVISRWSPWRRPALAGVGDGDEVEHLAVLDAAVGRLDEAVLVDAREARERADEADVRAFRRLDGADASVVGGMDVAHLEAGALARQTARPKRREAALVGDLGERVGLVHELRELARSRRTRGWRPSPAWR